MTTLLKPSHDIFLRGDYIVVLRNRSDRKRYSREHEIS